MTLWPLHGIQLFGVVKWYNMMHNFYKCCHWHKAYRGAADDKVGDVSVDPTIV